VPKIMSFLAMARTFPRLQAKFCHFIRLQNTPREEGSACQSRIGFA
jgi:hypothetical protein